MADKVSLQVQTRDTNGNLQQKSITNVNPAATATAMDNVVRAIVSLTTDSYVDSTIIRRSSLNDAVAAQG